MEEVQEFSGAAGSVLNVERVPVRGAQLGQRLGSGAQAPLEVDRLDARASNVQDECGVCAWCMNH